MSCNGCRVLRKGCSENCILRPCLQWIDSPQAQGQATVFVAKFFGRAGLMSFLSSVLEHQRPALFQSLLFEACGRTVNPVTGAVGLLWTGNWHACQAAVQTVLRGGTLRPFPEFVGGGCTLAAPTGLDEASEAEAVVCTDTYELEQDPIPNSSRSKGFKRRCVDELPKYQSVKLGLSTLKPVIVQRRAGTPSRNSEESVVTRTTDCFEIDGRDPHAQAGGGGESKLLLNLFN